MMAPAPGRFSITKLCLSCSERCCAITRPNTSAGPPAPNGTIMRTDFDGYCCAATCAGREARKTVTAANRARLLMNDPPHDCRRMIVAASAPINAAAGRSCRRLCEHSGALAPQLLAGEPRPLDQCLELGPH